MIYSNKEMNSKPHLTSWHAYLGVFALVGWIALGLAGAAALCGRPPSRACHSPVRPQRLQRLDARVVVGAGTRITAR